MQLFLLINFFWLCWVFVAALGLSLFMVSGDYSLAVVRRLLMAVASRCRARALDTQPSVVVAHGLSRCAACGILPDQGSNLCPLPWQVDF